MPLKILFKYTSRSRRDNFFRGLDSIVNNLANKEDYSIQCTFDTSDLEMNNKEVIDRLHTYKKLTYYFGESLNKIHAINSNIEKFPKSWDIIFNMSDDQVITQFGFDNIIREEMEKHFPETNGVLHFPDTVTGSSLITLSIFGRKYFDIFGFIYDPCFESVYSDNQFQDIAKVLGKYVFIDKSIYQHLHPAFGLAPTDEQYLRTEHPTVYDKDRNTYMINKANNFGL